MKEATTAIRFLTDPGDKQGFEQTYLDVRAAEQRLYSLTEVTQLPRLHQGHPHYDEWLIREDSMKRFLGYLKAKDGVKRILEVGCGNGWFSAAIAKHFPGKEVVGCDLNLFELKQAASVFDFPNLKFTYADIFESWPGDINKYDLILLASSAQYFPDMDKLVKALKSHAREGAEIHFLDTHFYPVYKIEEAAERTRNYYKELGFPHMASHYFHHSLEDLELLDAEFLYKPPSGIAKWLRVKANPFWWVKIEV